MRDYPALAKCPRGKRGQHDGDSFVTVNEDGLSTFTWTCGKCGMTRLVGPEGFTPPEPLDDLDAADILEAVRRR